MVLIALTYTQQYAVAHEAAEFKGRVEVDIFTEDQVIWHIRQWGVHSGCGCIIIYCVRHTVIKWVIQIMGDEIAAFQKEVYVIRGAALGVVCGGHEGRIFRSTPVQLWSDNAAKFSNGILYLGVNPRPLGGGIGFLFARVGECVQVIIVGWRGDFGWKDDAVSAEVFDESGC